MAHRTGDGVHDPVFEQGQHICTVYDTRAQQLAVAAGYISDGLARNERCLYVVDALDAGFNGLRTCGDMSWLLRGAEGSEHVLEYEALLNQYFPTVRAIGMCQYDRSRLPARTVEGAVARHPCMAAGRSSLPNPSYQPSL